ncbi:MAG TPA: hypothetical protein VLC49_11425 [Solirubrobacteraceae bacterium]|nr:hypothetical protein [Solirubrobacteraceae bacterium]
MPFVIVLVLAAGVWIAVVLFVVSLCGAAKLSDEAIDAALATAARDVATASSESESPERGLRTLSLDEAAALLGINPYTLLAWEARYGFPTSSPQELYSRSEVLALRDCLRDGVSIASAVTRARARMRRRRAGDTARPSDRHGGGFGS